MRRGAALVAMICAPVLLLAQVSRMDFVRGAEIRTQGNASLFRILVPDDVYDTSTRPDLADVRVLNAAGEPVPHTLREVPRSTSPEAEWRTVPSFPMTEEQSSAPAHTHVKIGADGAVLEVRSNGAPGRSTTAYLIDASAVKEPLTKIAVTWETSPGATFLAPVSVSASDDLNRWRVVVASSALAQLQRESFMLSQNEIDLPEHGEQAKYFRISWPRALAGASLKSVRVRPRTTAAQREIRWRTLMADRIDPINAAHYDTHAFLPVEFVDVEFADLTDAASVTIRSRASTTDPWVQRHSGLFYALQSADGSIHSSPVAIDRTTERDWVIETMREGGWKPNRAPRLKIGWHPHELLFVAQGAAPYTLVYGSGRVGRAEAPVDELLASLSETKRATQIGQAAVAEPRTLGGPEALTPGPEPIPWKRIALWGVLIVAVASLALVAIRLLRETEKAA